MGPIESCPPRFVTGRSEEHTSELQSRSDLVCRLLLEKKKNTDVRAEHTSPPIGTSIHLDHRHSHLNSREEADARLRSTARARSAQCACSRAHSQVSTA